MRDAVIVEAVRTPVGKRGGALAGIHPAVLSSAVLRELVARAGIDAAEVDDVIWGCVTQSGEQAMNIARAAVLGAGWPETVPATTVDRQCGSSQQAVHLAAATVMSGQSELVVAGGVESMSRVPMLSSIQGADPLGPEVAARYGGALPHQGESAERIAERWGLSRTQLDEYALESHARAAAAQDAGAFDRQIVPWRFGDGRVMTADEGVRRGGTLETMAGLRPVFRDDGMLTAGSSSQMSDAAAAVLVTTSEVAARRGLSVLARIRCSVVVADDPVMMLTAPIPGTRRALQRAGLALADIDVFEINEAFASVPLAWAAETGADRARLNPLGGAIALGHPLGASGARLLTTMVHHLRDSGLRFGLQAMCEGGGQANVTIIEAV